MSAAYAWFLGIDWGGDEHHFCLVEADGTIVGTRAVAHTATALREALQWVRERVGGRLDALAVGLETPRGILVDTLIDHGFAVFALNPKQLDRFRDRFTAAGAKDDRRDAQAVADGLRTDPRAFRAVHPDDPQVLVLRELCRIVEDLHTEEGRLTNRLREQLYRVDAAWLTLSPAADEPWLWAVLAEAPHPQSWATTLPTTGDVRAARAPYPSHHPRCRARRASPAAAPDRRGVCQTRSPFASRHLSHRSGSIHEQRTTAERQIDRLLEQLASAESTEGQPHEHRDVEILRSLPGVGRMVAATMLTEAAGAIAERDYATLRTYAGAAPVTKRSGKRVFLVQMRYACKPRLRQALYHWARVSIPMRPRGSLLLRAPARTRSSLCARPEKRRRSLVTYPGCDAGGPLVIRPIAICCGRLGDRLTNGGKSLCLTATLSSSA